MRFNANFWSLAEKEKKVNNWNEHIKWANEERDYYRYQFKLIKYLFIIISSIFIL